MLCEQKSWGKSDGEMEDEKKIKKKKLLKGVGAKHLMLK